MQEVQDYSLVIVLFDLVEGVEVAGLQQHRGEPHDPALDEWEQHYLSKQVGD